MALRAQVQPGGPLTQLVRRFGILRVEPFGVECDKRVRILREAAGHRFGQPQVARRFAQKRFGKLQIEGARLARQLQVFFSGAALAGQFIGHALHDQLAGGTAAQHG